MEWRQQTSVSCADAFTEAQRWIEVHALLSQCLLFFFYILFEPDRLTALRNRKCLLVSGSHFSPERSLGHCFANADDAHEHS